jgi:hypothetical protein
VGVDIWLFPLRRNTHAYPPPCGEGRPPEAIAEAAEVGVWRR